nr:MAG TPA: hypothetical protein [Caudoviricetes sp.]
MNTLKHNKNLLFIFFFRHDTILPLYSPFAKHVYIIASYLIFLHILYNR